PDLDRALPRPRPEFGIRLLLRTAMRREAASRLTPGYAIPPAPASAGGGLTAVCPGGSGRLRRGGAGRGRGALQFFPGNPLFWLFCRPPPVPPDRPPPPPKHTT